MHGWVRFSAQNAPFQNRATASAWPYAVDVRAVSYISLRQSIVDKKTDFFVSILRRARERKSEVSWMRMARQK
jgi:hypothetical protein